MLSRAEDHERAGELLEAGQLYQAILQADPGHPEANHNLGVIAVKAGHADVALNYLAAALDAEPANGRYWLSYIDTLFRAGRQDDARSLLELARRQGLEGEAVDALAAQLDTVETRPDAAATATSGTSPSRQEIEAFMGHFNAGRLSAARDAAEALTQRFPSDAFAWKALGVVLKTLGQDADALTPMRTAASLSPDDAEAHYNLGVVLQRLDRLEEAEACYRRALECQADYADAWLNLGVMLHKMDRPVDAEACLREAVRLRPESTVAQANLGALFESQGKLEEAEACYRQILKAHPEAVEGHLGLGRIYRMRGRLEEAERALANALAIGPEQARAHAEMALTLHELDRLLEADTHFMHALRLDPNDPLTLGNRGNLLCQMERFAEAESCYRLALRLAPNEARLHGNLGKLLRNVGRLHEAEQCFRQVCQLDPDNDDMRNRLALVLKDCGRLEEAEACYRSLLQSQPGNVNVMSNLGCVLMAMGRIDDAIECFRRTLELVPDQSLTYSNFLYALTLSGSADPRLLYTEHVRFGERFEAPHRTIWPAHPNSRDPDRLLQVGFVSADFNDHAVASFIEPVLAELSRYNELSLHAYYNHFINDAVTKRLRPYFAHWHGVSGLDDDALAEKIRADEIDILIDLSGHTGYNRLVTFARKPAPVQASWIGYPATTGLRAIDYYLADRFLVPPGKIEDQFTERVIRLPANAPFAAFVDAPPVNALPALDHGYVTFGSFNRADKINRGAVALWSRLLRALPDSRMLLGGMPETGYRDQLIGWFTEEGIAPDRLDVHPRSNMKSYMALHHQVDICLDTMPYNGGTTSLHALWMGVPTLTVVGDTMAARVGAAVMSQVGQTGFIADCAEDFVARGVSWAENLSDLAAVRAGLRERLVQSPLGKPEWVAAGLNHALRGMWRRWCAGLPAEAFELPACGYGDDGPGPIND